MEHLAVVLDETEPHLGGPEKMPMAFLRNTSLGGIDLEWLENEPQ